MDYSFVEPGKFIVELLILWFAFYMLLLFVKGTRAVQVLKGVIILVIVFLVSKELRLETINHILTKLFTISVIAFVIIFQQLGIKGFQLADAAFQTKNTFNL